MAVPSAGVEEVLAVADGRAGAKKCADEEVEVAAVALWSPSRRPIAGRKRTLDLGLVGDMPVGLDALVGVGVVDRQRQVV